MTIRPMHLAVFLAGIAVGAAFLMSCGGSGGSGIADAHTDFSTVYSRRTSLNSASVNATSAYSPIGPVLSFTKVSDATQIEVLLNTRVSVASFAGGSFGARFELRIDGAPSPGSIHNHGSVRSTHNPVFVSIFAAFGGLSAGSHSAQVWVRSDGGGTAMGTLLDTGGAGGALITREVP